MAKDALSRKLAAIVAADVVGYSRLMEADEAGTLSALRAARKDVLDPKIDEYGGRMVKTTGDGFLVEFGSAVDAVHCAVEVQEAIAVRNEDVPEDHAICLRIGVNLGDVVIEGDDIFGEGVNVAARLESLAPRGGVLISQAVHDQVAGKVGAEFADGGERAVKNMKKPVHVWEWRAGDQGPNVAAEPAASSTIPEQEIRFCRAGDGAQIAYATVGSGPPLVKAPNWMNHLEYDWQSPVWRHLLRDLAAEHTLVRFDQRCNGLSDWEVPEISFESFVSDLETVVDAVGLERFSLIGVSQGCAISIAYAIRHPERVSCLVLYGGFAIGRLRTGSEADKQESEFMRQMISKGWGQDNPAFRQFFSSLFMPGATKEQMDWFNELQRNTISPENAVRVRKVLDNVDVSDLLPRVSAPTLVLHCRGDGIVPFEAGRRMAAGIPGSRFVPLEGQNHLILETDAAWPRFMDEVKKFLAADNAAD